MMLRLLPFFLLVAACGAEAPESRATFAFEPSEVLAKRAPVGAGCFATNVPFGDDDLFTLQPINRDGPRGIGSIAVTFKRTVAKDVALVLTIDGAPAGPRGPERASSPDERGGVDVTVFGAGSTFALEKTLTKAQVTMTEIPAKEGDATSAHVTLEFADGDILDETFTGKLESYPGACASGG